MGEFGVVILSMKPPRVIARLAERIRREVPGACVRGILYERHVPRPFGARIVNAVRSLPQAGYIRYAASRVLHLLGAPLRMLGHLLLRLAHACPRDPNGRPDFTLKDLARIGKESGFSLHVTSDMHSREAKEFVGGLRADLGILYGTRILKPELYEIPRLGCVNIHKGKVPDYRGGGPVGLWELLEDQKEIGVTVHRVERAVDAGPVIHATTIPIQPYDNLRSLALKAAVVGDDLLVSSVADFVSGCVEEKPQTGNARTFRAPKPHQLANYKRQLAKRRPEYRPPRTRPAWKLILRSIVFAPLSVARNWIYRARKSFPVVILYHHLITDRRHHLGTPTEHFDRQAEFLTKYYRVASLGEAMEMLGRGRVEAPTVVLTFDDGYAENFINLRAITQARGIPVALFISTAHMSTQEPFGHDLKRDQHGFSPLTWEQVQFLSRSGYEFGAHTRSHFDCGSTDPAALEEEIAGSGADLEKHLGAPVPFFSFPWGLAQNMSRPAVELAHTNFPYLFDAAGGINVPVKNSRPWFFHRRDHPSDLWELELTLQSLLNVVRLSEALPGIVPQASRS